MSALRIPKDAWQKILSYIRHNEQFIFNDVSKKFAQFLEVENIKPRLCSITTSDQFRYYKLKPLLRVYRQIMNQRDAYDMYNYLYPRVKVKANSKSVFITKDPRLIDKINPFHVHHSICCAMQEDNCAILTANNLNKIESMSRDLLRQMADPKNIEYTKIILQRHNNNITDKTYFLEWAAMFNNVTLIKVLAPIPSFSTLMNIILPKSSDPELWKLMTPNLNNHNIFVFRRSYYYNSMEYNLANNDDVNLLVRAFMEALPGANYTMTVEKCLNYLMTKRPMSLIQDIKWSDQLIETYLQYLGRVTCRLKIDWANAGMYTIQYLATYSVIIHPKYRCSASAVGKIRPEILCLIEDKYFSPAVIAVRNAFRNQPQPMVLAVPSPASQLESEEDSSRASSPISQTSPRYSY